MSHDPARHRLALIHAMRPSIAPIDAALEAGWPDVDAMHLLDDSLPRDLERAGGRVTDAIATRFVALARYAVSAGAEGILFTCSAFGPAIDAVKQAVAVPVSSPHEAMLERAVDGSTVIALVATFPATLPALTSEMKEIAMRRGRPVDVLPVLAEGALAALQRGDAAGHDAAIRDAVVHAIEARPDVEVVALGQFSMARAAEAVQAAVAGVAAATPVAVLTTPGAAVDALRAKVMGHGQGRT